MAQAVLEHEQGTQPPMRRQLTRYQCEVLQSAGLLEPGRYELINGDLIDKMKNRPHVIMLWALCKMLQKIFGWDYLNTEPSIDVSQEDYRTSALDPDLIVLRTPTPTVRSNPRASDIALAVEVSDSSLSTDLHAKAGLYARAGIADYWVVDINRPRIIVHREPTGLPGESVSPLALPGARVAVKELFDLWEGA